MTILDEFDLYDGVTAQNDEQHVLAEKARKPGEGSIDLRADADADTVRTSRNLMFTYAPMFSGSNVLGRYKADKYRKHRYTEDCVKFVTLHSGLTEGAPLRESLIEGRYASLSCTEVGMAVCAANCVTGYLAPEASVTQALAGQALNWPRVFW